MGVQPGVHVRLGPQVGVDRAEQLRRELGAGCPALDHGGLLPHPVGGHLPVLHAAAHTGEAPDQPVAAQAILHVTAQLEGVGEHPDPPSRAGCDVVQGRSQLVTANGDQQDVAVCHFR